MSETYVVVYERDKSGWWLASVPTVPGCRTQGRTIDQARERIREALALFIGDTATAELVDQINFPDAVVEAMKRYAQARHETETAGAKAQTLQYEAASALKNYSRLGVRDAGSLLDLSYQRVQQIIDRPTDLGSYPLPANLETHAVQVLKTIAGDADVLVFHGKTDPASLTVKAFLPGRVLVYEVQWTPPKGETSRPQTRKGGSRAAARAPSRPAGRASRRRSGTVVHVDR